MTQGWKILLVLSAALVMALAAPARADKRIALVIGNSNYENVQRLSNPQNDAEDLAATLKNLNFDVVFRTNIDQRGMSSALEEFERKAVGADTALFFFAGHGLQYKGQNYLLPIDADLKDDVSLKYNTLPIERVREAISTASGVKIMVLDACRNNPIADKLVLRTAALTRSTTATRGLARLDRAEGMVVAYATQADDVAQDGSGRNSPFSAALNRRLAEPNLEIATLFRRVAQDVYEQTGGKQRPELSISLLQDFYLNLKEDDSQAWRRLGSDPSEAALRDFIAKFPYSPFVRDAQNRIYIIESARIDEGKRAEIARLQEELKLLREREELRVSLEKAEKERQERERQETERIAALRRENELMEAERRQKEVEEAKARDQARLDEQRRQAEKLAAEREAEAKKAAEKLERQRLAAEKAEQERLEAEKAKAEAAEKKRLEAERLDAERREKARLAADEKERKRLEAERLAAEQAEKARIEKEQREAAAREEKRLADQKAEADRQEKERLRIAKLEDDNRRKAEAEAENQRKAQICVDEKINLARLSGEKNTDELKAFRTQAKCPSLVAAIDAALTQILAAQEKACRAEQTALRKINKEDFNGLKLFAASATCADARKEAGERVAALEADITRREAACQAEDAEFQQLHARLQNKEKVFEALSGLQARLQCERLRQPVAEAVRLAKPPINTPDQVKSAQVELQRVGCYDGAVDGELSDTIKASVKLYWIAKAGKSAAVVVDDALIDSLKGEPSLVCHPKTPVIVEQPAKPSGKPAAEKPRFKRHPVAKQEEDEAPAPARRKHVAPAVERPAPAQHAAPRRAPASHAAAPTYHPRPAGPAASRPSPSAIMGTGF